jgi:hypothetical protein
VRRIGSTVTMAVMVVCEECNVSNVGGVLDELIGF